MRVFNKKALRGLFVFHLAGMPPLPASAVPSPFWRTAGLGMPFLHGTILLHDTGTVRPTKAAASGSSFYYAFLFLPPARRAAITAFYAFCREVDDVVDEVSDAGVARTKLAWWQAEVARSFAGQPPAHPVMQALMPHTGMYGIEERHLQAVIEGCQMDLEQTRYLDFQGLSRYCHLVAGIVGEVAARIFGPSDERTVEYAHTLGLAFQLTNIIRDVGEDAMMGRIYLPVAELQQFDVKAHEILKRQYSDRFTALMRFQAERAHGLYDKAPLPAPGRPAAGTETRIDDGQHLPDPAAGNREGPVPGAAPADRTHAPAQAVAGVEDAGPGPDVMALRRFFRPRPALAACRARRAAPCPRTVG